MLLITRIVKTVSGRQATSSGTPCSETGRTSVSVSTLPHLIKRVGPGCWGKVVNSWLCPASLESHKGQCGKGHGREKRKARRKGSQQWGKRPGIPPSRCLCVQLLRESACSPGGQGQGLENIRRPRQASCGGWRSPGPRRPDSILTPWGKQGTGG